MPRLLADGETRMSQSAATSFRPSVTKIPADGGATAAPPTGCRPSLAKKTPHSLRSYSFAQSRGSSGHSYLAYGRATRSSRSAIPPTPFSTRWHSRANSTRYSDDSFAYSEYASDDSSVTIVPIVFRVTILHDFLRVRADRQLAPRPTRAQSRASNLLAGSGQANPAA